MARCLASLRANGVATVVVDNASRDGSVALVRERFPEMRLVALEQNIGFAAACNRGVLEAETPFLFLVNPDAEPHPGAIEALHDVLRLVRSHGRRGPRLVDESGRESVSVLGFPTRWWRGAPPASAFRGRRAPPASVEATLHGEFALGAALLLRRVAFDEVGGFDPGFFLFYEEVDLCRRLAAAGWTLEQCPSAVVTHVGGAATRLAWASAYREQLRGHLRYLEKHEGRRAASISRLVLFAAIGARYLLARGEHRDAYRAGLGWLARMDLDEVAAPAPADRLAPAEA